MNVQVAAAQAMNVQVAAAQAMTVQALIVQVMTVQVAAVVPALQSHGQWQWVCWPRDW